MKNLSSKDSLQLADLILLKVLDALLIEKSTTHAATRLGLTQSAVSHALSRLRHLFKDELFVREQGKLSMTPLAKELEPKIDNFLKEAALIINSSSVFVPKSSTRTLTIAMPDYLISVLLPPLFQIINTQAPHIKLNIRRTDAKTMVKDMSEEGWSLAVGVVSKTSPLIGKNLQIEPLFTDQFICAAANNHFLWKEKLTLERYLSCDHLEVLRDTKNTGLLELALAKKGFHRNIRLSTQQFNELPNLIQTSGLVATEPAKLLIPWAKKFNYKVEELPIETPKITVSIVKHRRAMKDTGYLWLAELIKNMFDN